MPKRKNASRHRRSTKRTRRGRSRRPGLRRLTVQRNPLMARSQIVKLKYVDRITIDPALDTVGSHVFRANSIFAPDVTGSLTAHQPMGRDEWEDFYANYTVIGSKINATFDYKIGGGVPTACGVLLKNNTNVLPGVTEMLEQGIAKRRFLQADKMTSVTRGFSPKKFFGVHNITDNKEQLGALMSANPLQPAYFHVFIAPLQSTSNYPLHNVLVEITYTCLLTERKTIGQS